MGEEFRPYVATVRRTAQARLSRSFCLSVAVCLSLSSLRLFASLSLPSLSFCLSVFSLARFLSLYASSSITIAWGQVLPDMVENLGDNKQPVREAAMTSIEVNLSPVIPAVCASAVI